jgi:hypothetical protein
VKSERIYGWILGRSACLGARVQEKELKSEGGLARLAGHILQLPGGMAGEIVRSLYGGLLIMDSGLLTKK